MIYKIEENMKPVSDAVETLLSEKKRIVIAIDGRSASGKSTAAEFLANKFGGDVVHADDFFLPFDMRSDVRLAEPGGNIHYERMYDEVITRLKRESVIEYGVFDCSTGYIGKTQAVDCSGIVIIEGAYSLHPKFGKYFDLSVFMTADKKTRLSRVEKRSSAAKAKVFEDRWMPMEEKYINEFKIDRSADIMISTDYVK